MGPFLIILLSGAVISLLAYNNKERKKRELKLKLAKEKKAQDDLLARNFFADKLSIIANGVRDFDTYCQYASGYFSNYDCEQWKHKYGKLVCEIKSKNHTDIGLAATDVATISAFLDHFNNCNSKRDSFNVNFITNELADYSVFFDNVEGRQLDLQQRTSIVTDDDNNIVIAGAGSGKTTTIVGKVNYVLDRYQVNPEEILLISFTNKSAETLAGRINIEGVEAKTFHKFGKDVMTEVDQRQPAIFDQANYYPLLQRFFREENTKPEYILKITEYFTEFLKPTKSQFEFEHQGEYIQYMKDQQYKSYKLVDVPVRGLITQRMEVVKSIEECKIANFLLFNGIEYQYEYPYEVETADLEHRQYHPDFKITHNGQVVYLEHFGIDKNGDVPNWFEGKDEMTAREYYHQGMDWKRQTHLNNETTLIETYSYEMSDGTLYDNLEAKLNELGIELQPLPPEEIWKIINRSASDEIKTFVNLIATFITLMKSNNYSIEQLIQQNRIAKEDFFRGRNSKFVEIVRPIYDKYQGHLEEYRQIDFSDMINKASAYINNNDFKRKFKYVIIDEFQDISIGRYQLVKAIKQANPSCKLFCVGDDWQSIYRFAGSDISLFKEFENYFGHTVKAKIETTYRFFDPLLSLSSDFILKNPNQTSKALRSLPGEKTTEYKIKYSSNTNQDDTLALHDIFEELLDTIPNLSDKEILILGRYGFDLNRVKNEDSIFVIDREAGKVEYRRDDKIVQADFLTVHKAKGLEADIVIIINCNSGKHGFPSEMSDDQVLNMLLSEADQFENGEERRLFYVAMTRAKEKLYMLADSGHKSKFIAELETEDVGSGILKCPRCATADLIVRREGTAHNGNLYRFYGCTNYLYGCNYTNTEWTNFT